MTTTLKMIAAAALVAATSTATFAQQDVPTNNQVENTQGGETNNTGFGNVSETDAALIAMGVGTLLLLGGGNGTTTTSTTTP